MLFLPRKSLKLDYFSLLKFYFYTISGFPQYVNVFVVFAFGLRNLCLLVCYRKFIAVAMIMLLVSLVETSRCETLLLHLCGWLSEILIQNVYIQLFVSLLPGNRVHKNKLRN